MQYAVRPSDPDAARELARGCNVAPAIGQILLHRGIADVEKAREFLSPLLSGLTAPDAMADRKTAAERLARALRDKERITVFGDYDVDGTASAAILAGILEQLGGRITVQVANRFEGGYGFSDTVLEQIAATDPSVVALCDCGSSDHPRLERARSAGLDVIVVDHHLVPAEPLPALAFLNPQRPDCGFPYKGLASVGLALSLGAAVRAELGVKLDLRPWLDLVALGTIADVAPLDGDNRRLVRAGLSLINSAGGRPGVMALCEAARIRPGAMVGATDVAFRFAPRLNAAGRLGDQTLTLSLLRSRSLAEARSLAVRIERINQERKSIEHRVSEEAAAQVLEIYGPEPDTGIVAVKDGWHRGVIGISASRLVERFGVPCAVIALQDGIGRGSCRASRGFRLYDALTRCRHTLESFGGHQGAGGFTIQASRTEAFRVAFADAYREIGAGLDNEPAIPSVDVQLRPGVFDLPTATDLSLLEPVGESNAEPVFLAPEARVEESFVVGGEHLKMTLRVGNERLSAFGFRLSDRRVETGCVIEALGVLRPDTWRGGDQIEMWLSGFESRPGVA